MRSAFIGLILLTACNDDLPRPEEIRDLRILGVRAEPPDGPAGTTVVLDALIVSPTQQPLETAWLACAGAGSDPSACVNLAGGTLPLPCAAGPAPVCLLGVGDAEPEPYTLPGGVEQVLIAVLAAEAGPGGLLGCQRSLLDAGTLPDYCRIGLKRINVLAPGETPNANPGFASIAVDGEQVTVTLSDGAAEPTPDGPEELFLSWFVTAGGLDSFRTDGDAEGLKNTWTGAEPPGDIYVVVRDGRGGEAWIQAPR